MKKIASVFLSLVIFCSATCQAAVPEPHILVLFGATGDLAQRKLLPALHHLSLKKQLPKDFICVGVGRQEKSHEEFRRDVMALIPNPETKFQERFLYFKAESEEDFVRLHDFLAEIDEQTGTAGNRLFYLATPASAFTGIVDKLHRHGFIHPPGEPWSRVIIEKPFGHDLSTAAALQEQIGRYLDETQIYRIDHYLGKPVVQQLLPFRQTYPWDEQINRHYVDHVHLTLSEELGVGTRGKLMEESGLLRDLVQNHLMQLLALVAMDSPASMQASAIQEEKVKVLKAIRPFPLDNLSDFIVRGQYGHGSVKGEPVPSYRTEREVAPDSNVETFVAAKLFIDNERWSGVPFFLKAGKRLDKSLVEIAIFFKSPALDPLIFRVQPHPAIIHAVIPTPLPKEEAYEVLLHESMRGDLKQFVSYAELEATWELFTPVLNYWKEHPAPDFPNYAAGTSGPQLDLTLTIQRLRSTKGQKTGRTALPFHTSPRQSPIKAGGEAFRG